MTQPHRGHRTLTWIAGAALVGTLVVSPAAAEAETDATAQRRAALVREIEAEVAYLAPQLGFDRLQPAVADAPSR
jgi:hypothetical protein